MVTIQTSVDFEAAHRQLGDESKCGYLHGHNWKVDFVLQGDKLNSVGYLTNFTVLKQLVAEFDHKVLLHREDNELISRLLDANQKIVTLTDNPTCEHLAIMICNKVLDQYPWKKDGQLSYVKITVWENNDSKAIAVWTPKTGIQ